MGNKNVMFRKTMIFIAAIIFSSIFLFIGNKIASKDLTAFDGEDTDVSYKALVLNIIDTEIYEYNLGGEENLQSKTLTFTAQILNGDMKDEYITATQTIDTLIGYVQKEVESDDKILVSKMLSDDEGSFDWVAGDYVRTDTLIILGVIFCVLLLFFGRVKGIAAIMSLIFTCLAVFMVFVPATLSGLNIYLWAIITCVFIILMTLTIVYGINIKSIAAAIGCFGGVIVAALLTIGMSKFFLLTGLTDEDSLYLSFLNPDQPIDLKAIIFASIIIGALGGIIDVAVSMASSLTEVNKMTISSTNSDSNKSSFGSLFKSGMAIGRDIMGANINTLILAYIGSSMSVVLLLIAYNRSLIAVLNREMIVVEILQSLIGSFGILLTIPLTSLICAILYNKNKIKT